MNTYIVRQKYNKTKTKYKNEKYSKGIQLQGSSKTSLLRPVHALTHSTHLGLLVDPVTLLSPDYTSHNVT